MVKRSFEAFFVSFFLIILYSIFSFVLGEAFFDITKGNTSTDCTEGFVSSRGWDATSGLGTPLFPGLLKYLQG